MATGVFGGTVPCTISPLSVCSSSLVANRAEFKRGAPGTGEPLMCTQTERCPSSWIRTCVEPVGCRVPRAVLYSGSAG